MKQVWFHIPRSRLQPSDTAVELCGDLGTGVIDYGRPLPPGRMRLWPAATVRVGHMLDGHLVARHLDDVDEDGHLEDMHLGSAHLEPELAMSLASPRYVFGRFRHALRWLDGAGNTSQAIERAVTINDSPDAPKALRRRGWNDETKQLVFEFRGVRFEAVAGA